MLDSDSVKKLSRLAKLSLTDAEVAKFTAQLDEILSFFEKLQEVDTQGVEPIAQITGMHNLARADHEAPSELADALLACSPRGARMGHIAVPKVI
jgi:aspartyl-tRNA(Asn)/glutamyl-tRNA(Gln) amidotransferase subunit C